MPVPRVSRRRLCHRARLAKVWAQHPCLTRNERLGLGPFTSHGVWVEIMRLLNWKVLAVLAIASSCHSTRGGAAASPSRDRGFHEVHVGEVSTTRYLSEESTGVRQSPINILTYATTQGQHAVRLHYQTSREHVTNLGHTVEVEMDPGSSLDFDGNAYDLVQFHFHTPSEHLIDGVTYPMELHLVHTLRGDPSHYLVVGVLFKEGQVSPLLKTLLAAAPGEVGRRVDVADVKVDAGELFAADEHYFHYEGSLTTPPYSESVKWLVLRRIHTAAPEQIGALNAIEGNNARHIQKLRSRAVDEN